MASIRANMCRQSFILADEGMGKKLLDTKWAISHLWRRKRLGAEKICIFTPNKDSKKHISYGDINPKKTQKIL